MTEAARRLSEEAARWRRQLRAEQARHSRTLSALDDANRMLLGVYLRDRLADPTDFELLVGRATVTDGEGRIVWALVDQCVAEIIASRPGLAAGELPRRRGTSAVDWFSTGT